MLLDEHFLGCPSEFSVKLLSNPPRTLVKPSHKILLFGTGCCERRCYIELRDLSENVLCTCPLRKHLLFISNGAGEIHDWAAAITPWKAVTPTSCHRLKGEE